MRPVRIGAAVAALVLLAAVTIVFVTPAGDHVSSTLAAQSLNCDMSQYKATSGLTAAIEQGALAVTWNGSNGSELRARYGIDNGQPVVRETVYGMAIVRCPYPHARIASVSLGAARAAEGVLAAFSGAALAEDWKGSLPCAWAVTEDIKMPPHVPLGVEEAR